MSAFIENVPEVYLSDPAMLEIGMEIWVVGQGGLTGVCEPYFEGRVKVLDHSISDGMEPNLGFFVIERTGDGRPYSFSRSYRDAHILPQTYNNWYVCSTKAAADIIYRFMVAEWDRSPVHERERERFSRRTRDWFGW